MLPLKYSTDLEKYHRVTQSIFSATESNQDLVRLSSPSTPTAVPARVLEARYHPDAHSTQGWSWTRGIDFGIFVRYRERRLRQQIFRGSRTFHPERAWGVVERTQRCCCVFRRFRKSWPWPVSTYWLTLESSFPSSTIFWGPVARYVCFETHGWTISVQLWVAQSLNIDVHLWE